jgi:hypothetical protein
VLIALPVLFFYKQQISEKSSRQNRTDTKSGRGAGQSVDFGGRTGADIDIFHRYIKRARHHVRVFGVGLE